MTYKEWYSKYVDAEEVVKESKQEVDDKVFVADKPNEIDDFFRWKLDDNLWSGGVGRWDLIKIL